MGDFYMVKDSFEFPKQSPFDLVVLVARSVLPNLQSHGHQSAFAARGVSCGSLSILSQWPVVLLRAAHCLLGRRLHLFHARPTA